ncbi:hypothetical protein [Umezawaea sp. Da 62-37]|uniref:hypothetical protein n=1 Tax=Umezawaea sp. Da 62-37 TaxID=3075927 RepID=UPI0028F739A2|nr:hypothetical protein [Umezawaea sp. Da 62-37]WNV85802.1 hypothetical protein RM788_48115 [Umezawaea sp. Da 62-37]
MTTTHGTGAVITTAPDGEVTIDYGPRVCTRCVLPAAFPGIGFDDDGVCSYCRDENERVGTTVEAVRSGIADALAGADPAHQYDCVALYSGGKDSSLALVRLSQDHGLKVLALTVDNGFLSDAAGENMRRIVDATGVDHVLFRPRRGFTSGLYRTSLEVDFGTETTKYSTSACGSCISLVLSIGIRFARTHAAPLLAGGWTAGQFTTSPVVGIAFLEDVIGRHFDPIGLATAEHDDELRAWRPGPGAHPVGLVNPLYAEQDYSEAAVVRELRSHGWEAPADTDSCSTNCRLNGLLIVDHVRRHGFHPYAYELAHHVRLGLLRREDAMGKMERIGVRAPQVRAVALELGLTGPVL